MSSTNALAETGSELPVIWVQSGFHYTPQALRARLQEEILKISNVEQILLAFGFCGNSLLGLSSPKAKLVVPRADDCISLLLDSVRWLKPLSRDLETYYLTRGWLAKERNIWQEYERCVMKYGQERAMGIIKEMLGNYRRLALISTGAYRLADCLEKSRELACLLNLEHRVVIARPRLLNKLLTGPWDHEFLIVRPGEEISIEYLLAP